MGEVPLHSNKDVINILREMLTSCPRIDVLSRIPKWLTSELADYFKVDMLGVWYKSVTFRAQKHPGAPNW